MAPKVSLIILTYMWPEALELVLASVFQQRVLPHEVVVTDDGSTDATAALIERMQASSPVPLKYVWQEDKGFRAARARNRGVAESTGDYLVFVDGDCVMFPDFIEQHLELREKDWFVAGNRILLAAECSQQVLKHKTAFQSWTSIDWFKARLSGKVNRLLPLLRLPDGNWRKKKARRWQGAKSCNLAMSRSDFVAVNGFDEAFNGWGHEDADIVARLIAKGCLRKEGRYAVPLIHIWHKEQTRELEKENLRRLAETLAGRRGVRAEQGLDSHGA